MRIVALFGVIAELHTSFPLGFPSYGSTVAFLEYEGAVYHVTARGNGRQAIYLDDTARRRFLDLLGREVEQ